jgi:hypothetical protein
VALQSGSCRITGQETISIRMLLLLLLLLLLLPSLPGWRVCIAAASHARSVLVSGQWGQTPQVRRVFCFSPAFISYSLSSQLYGRATTRRAHVRSGDAKDFSFEEFERVGCPCGRCIESSSLSVNSSHFWLQLMMMILETMTMMTTTRLPHR